MDVQKLGQAVLAALKPYEAQLAKQAWEQLIHPELKKLEAQLPAGMLASLAAVLDPMLDKLVEDEIAKLPVA